MFKNKLFQTEPKFLFNYDLYYKYEKIINNNKYQINIGLDRNRTLMKNNNDAMCSHLFYKNYI